MFTSMFIVAASIIETILESHWYFRIVRLPSVNGTKGGFEQAPNPENYRHTQTINCGADTETQTLLTMDDYPVTDAHPALDIVDDVCIVSIMLVVIHVIISYT